MTNERIGNRAPDWGRDYGLRALWTQLAPGLWVGGTHDDDTVNVPREAHVDPEGRRFLITEPAEITLEEFDAVVTMYAWARPVGWGVEELRWGIDDNHHGAQEVDLEALRETVVWAHRRWRSGRKVLARCQAGLNRGPLVAALVLVRDGMEPFEAIDLVRTNRSRSCLFNQSFARLINETPPEFWRIGLATEVTS